MRTITIVSLLGFIALFGCRTNLPRHEAGNAGNPRRVLVAGEDTAFKQAVLARVIEKLGTRDWYFRIVGLDSLQDEEPQRYGAILLMTAYRAGRLDERVTRYLAGDPADSKLLLFYTRGGEDPLPERRLPDIRVDAISSASRKDLVESKAQELAVLLERKF